jgi:hypothetical protein
MLFLERHTLKTLFQKIDATLNAEISIVVAGGSAVLILCDGAKATKDVDLLPGENVPRFFEAFQSLSVREKAELDLNTASAAFESYLPENWMERVVLAESFSGRFLSVFTPCPEDLAIMKLFRFVAKDVEDIQQLFALSSFDLNLFRNRFYSVLPVAIGDPRWHAQSFAILWNRQMPDNPLSVEQILDACGLKS